MSQGTENADMRTSRPPKRSGWFYALVAIVICCAGEVKAGVSYRPPEESALERDTTATCPPVTPQDSTTLETLSSNDTIPVKKKTGWQKFISYFADANKEKEEKKFDFSIIGGPHYSKDVKLGLGVVASGLYRMDPEDREVQPSNVSIYGDITTSGSYLIGVRGNNFFPKDKYRLSYKLYTFSFPSDFWGIGYENGYNDANQSEYRRLQNQVGATFLFRVAKNFYLGPEFLMDYTYGKDVERPELLNGQKTSIWSLGTGFNLSYDSRDFQTNASRGIYLNVSQYYFPKWLGSHSKFGRTDVIFDYYQSVWKGGIVAFDFHTQLNYGNTPWTMLAQMGGSYRMRGYYEGRYRDECLSEVQVEIRQHVWRRIGVTVWGGAGNVYRNLGRFRVSETLPNCGIGLRWEFKKRVNVRLDYGFGKKQSGFIFQINEAF